MSNIAKYLKRNGFAPAAIARALEYYADEYKELVKNASISSLVYKDGINVKEGVQQARRLARQLKQ
ncbi:MAG: hypothetical protein ACXWW0_00170 [Bacteroidia bacterium]